MRGWWIVAWTAISVGLASTLPLPAIAVGVLGGLYLAPKVPAETSPWMRTDLLSWAIILLGATIPATAPRDVMANAPILAVAILVPILLLGLAGRRWGMAIGSAICGASAIAAAKPALQLDDDETSQAVAAVSIVGTVGLLAIPIMATLWNLPQDVAGAWAGATLHAVPQAVGAGFAVGPEAGATATTLKLTRVALLPLLLLAASLAGGKGRIRMPKEVTGFVLVALLAHSGWFSADAIHAVGWLAKWMLLVGLVALAMNTRMQAKSMGAAIGWCLIAWLSSSAAVLWLL